MINISFSIFFKKGIEIAKLNEKVIEDVSNDKSALSTAVLFFGISGALSSLFTFNPIAIIMSGILSAGLSFVGIFILHLFAKLFKGKGNFMQLYKGSGIGSVISWIAVIPIIGFFATLWSMVVNIIIIRKVYKLSTLKAVLVVIIPAIIVMSIMTVLAVLLFSNLINMSTPYDSLLDINSII